MSLQITRVPLRRKAAKTKKTCSPQKRSHELPSEEKLRSSGRAASLFLDPAAAPLLASCNQARSHPIRSRIMRTTRGSQMCLRRTSLIPNHPTRIETGKLDNAAVGNRARRRIPHTVMALRLDAHSMGFIDFQNFKAARPLLVVLHVFTLDGNLPSTSHTQPDAEGRSEKRRGHWI